MLNKVVYDYWKSSINHLTSVEKSTALQVTNFIFENVKI